jgi:hypothetical protein
MLVRGASICSMSGITGKHSGRLLKKAVQQGPRRGGTGGVPSGYVEDSVEPRTKLEDFFSSLLVLGRDGGETSHTASFFAWICPMAVGDLLVS